MGKLGKAFCNSETNKAKIPKITALIISITTNIITFLVIFTPFSKRSKDISLCIIQPDCN